MNQLVYISNYPNSVFQSQVVELLNFIENAGNFDKIVLLVSSKKKKTRARDFYDQGLNESINIEIIKSYPSLSIFQSISKRELIQSLNRIGLSKQTIIHTRTDKFSTALKSIDLSGAKVVVDYRGVSNAENQIYKKSNPIVKYYRSQNYRNSLRSTEQICDAVSVVSVTLKSHLLNISNIPAGKIYINHSLGARQFSFDEKSRLTCREKLNLKIDDILAVFMTGGDAQWQNTNKIIDDLANKNIKILNLSKKVIDHQNVINIFTDFRNVPKYLSAADFGVILRDDNIVNHVASPVKFSEYVCSGLPVVANSSVDQIAKYIQTTGFGILVSDLKELSVGQIGFLLSQNRKAIEDYGKSHFGINTIGVNYLEMYSKVLNGY